MPGRIDVGRLFLALLIALALYGAVRAEQNPPETGTFDVPVDVSNIPQGLLLISGETSSVQLRAGRVAPQFLSDQSNLAEPVVLPVGRGRGTRTRLLREAGWSRPGSYTPGEPVGVPWALSLLSPRSGLVRDNRRGRGYK